MAWRKAFGSDFSTLEQFLRRRERRAVLPSERLRQVGVGRSAIRRQRFFLYEKETGITSVLYVGAGGLYFPLELVKSTDGTVPVSDAWRPLHSIMGTPADVEALERSFSVAPVHRMRYFTMTLDTDTFPERTPAPIRGLTVYRPEPPEWRRLLPLQIAYEREEVLLPGHAVNVGASRSTIIDSLRNQLVLVAMYGGKPVARVATNARGFSCDQIGGVYTVPELRRFGISHWLMSELLEQIGSANRMASLFVKPHNEAAIALYRRLGFVVEGEFAIHYYG